MTKLEWNARKQQVEQILRTTPGLTNDEIGKKLGMSERSVRRYKAKINETTTNDSSDETLRSVRLKRQCDELRGRVTSLERALEEKDAALHQYADIAEAPRTSPIIATKTTKREVVPVIVASDWHIEETVTAAITNGLNEYNLKIAEGSIKQFFSNAVYLVKRAMADSIVHTIVLAVLGDIINGVLRSEDLENNQASSIDALSMARSFLYSGIKLLEKETGCKIRVICCVGNHGRLTEKIHYSNQVHNSLEYLIYKTLERDFRDHKNVDFIVSEAPYVIQSIFGVRVRFQHGHVFRYNGGISGISVPILRKVAQLNTIEHADLDVIGHFHTATVLSNVIINGSLVGTNGFSMALGLPHERPQQMFFLIDSKYGKSMITPVFIDREVSKPVVPSI